MVRKFLQWNPDTWIINITMSVLLSVFIHGCASDSAALDEMSEPVSEDGLNQSADADNDAQAEQREFNNSLYNNLALSDQQSDDEDQTSDDYGDNFQGEQDDELEQDYALEQGDDIYGEDAQVNDSNPDQAGYDQLYGEQEQSTQSGDIIDNLALVENDSYDQLYAQQSDDMSSDTDSYGDSDYGDDGYGNLAATEQSYTDNSSGLYDQASTGNPYDIANQQLGQGLEDQGFETEGDLLADGYETAQQDLISQSGTQLNLPELGSKMSYVVQAGDTLGKIAMKIYGDQSFWKEINDLSGLENPNLIYPGNVVYYRLTETTQSFAAAYENTPKGEVTVQQGDTLSTISAQVYGDQSHWQSIWRANDKIDNPDKLSVGEIVYFVDQGAVLAAIEKWSEYFAQINQESFDQEIQKVNVDFKSFDNLAADFFDNKDDGYFADIESV